MRNGLYLRVESNYVEDKLIYGPSGMTTVLIEIFNKDDELLKIFEDRKIHINQELKLIYNSDDGQLIEHSIIPEAP